MGHFTQCYVNCVIVFGSIHHTDDGVSDTSGLIKTFGYCVPNNVLLMKCTIFHTDTSHGFPRLPYNIRGSDSMLCNIYTIKSYRIVRVEHKIDIPATQGHYVCVQG